MQVNQLYLVFHCKYCVCTYLIRKSSSWSFSGSSVWVCEEVPHDDFDDGNTVLNEDEEEEDVDDDDPGDAKDGAVCDDKALKVEVEVEGDLELELELELEVDFEPDFRELLTDSGCL